MSQWFENQKDSPKLQSLYDVQYSMCLNIYLLLNWFAQLFFRDKTHMWWKPPAKTCQESCQCKLSEGKASVLFVLGL